MTQINIEDPNLPVDVQCSRIDVLDVLRGIAILGIFLINLPTMGPEDGGVEKAINFSVYDTFANAIVELLVDGTQRGMLQMLFGAGMLLLTAKALLPTGPVKIADMYLRRNLWLILFGILHVFVVRWAHDILHIYGLAALFLFVFRKLPAPIALVFGLGIALAMQLISHDGNMLVDTVFANDHAVITPGIDAVQKWYSSVKGLGLWSTVAEAFATMLLGVALFKWGIIQGLKSRSFYTGVAVLGYAVGLTLRTQAIQELSDSPLGPNPSELGRIFTTLGHIGLFNLLWQSRIGARILSPFKAVGKTAFSLYILQSLIGIWILWAPQGPLTVCQFGSAGVLGVAILAIAFQVILANLWLTKFRYGPLELLWRRLAAL